MPGPPGGCPLTRPEPEAGGPHGRRAEGSRVTAGGGTGCSSLRPPPAPLRRGPQVRGARSHFQGFSSGTRPARCIAAPARLPTAHCSPSAQSPAVGVLIAAPSSARLLTAALTHPWSPQSRKPDAARRSSPTTAQSRAAAQGTARALAVSPDLAVWASGTSAWGLPKVSLLTRGHPRDREHVKSRPGLQRGRKAPKQRTAFLQRKKIPRTAKRGPRQPDTDEGSYWAPSQQKRAAKDQDPEEFLDGSARLLVLRP